MARYLREIWRCRFFWMSLVHLDLRTRYRGSGLGLGWSLARPIAMTIILCLVFQGVFAMDARHYAPYLLTGLACWSYLSAIALEGCHCLLQAEPYIRQHRAPMAIYPLRSALAAGAHFLLALGLVLLLVGLTLGFPHPLSLFSLMPGILLLFLFGWSCSIIGGLVNVYFRDTQHVCDVVMQMLFYTTPVLYPPEMLQERGLGWIVSLNPLASFLDLLRQPILEGRVPSTVTFATASLTVALTAGAAALIMARFERRVVFHF